MSYTIKHGDGHDLYVAKDVSNVRAALQAAVKEGAYLPGANLRRANLGGADLRGADLRGANLRAADLRDANLYDAYLYGADLRRADLGGADLRGANLYDADLYVADLRRADLRRADLGGADLPGANLRAADLGGADLRGANLRDANLGGANLRAADLRGADLYDAYLYGAKGINPYLTTPLHMLTDQPGPIRAYKLVNEHGQGPQYGGIVYEPGATIEVDDANSDPEVSCGAGLNVATLDWCMTHWREGYRILLVEFTADDIAAIPHGTGGKFRVHRLTVVGEKDLTELGMVPS
jgi:hypothetical protein